MPASYVAPSLRHEHLIRVNEPSIAPAHWLTRQQLWEGLKHTVLMPQSMDQSIDATHLLELSPNTVRREIRRSSRISTDEVDWLAEQSLTIRCDARAEFGGSTLTIRIEEPAPQVLFVRFVYELFGLGGPRSQEEDNARRSAYEAADIERIRAVRRYAGRMH